MAEYKKRETAYKLRIGELLSGKPVIEGEGESLRFNSLEIADRNVYRVNIAANVVDKYVSEGEKKYATFTIDDASGQIRIKVFGTDADRFSPIVQGNSVIVIGTLRYYNNEIYINPEIIRVIDPRYLLVRKLEIDNGKPKEVNKETVRAVKDQIIEMIKAGEKDGGIETEKIVMQISNAPPEVINQEITKLLEEGLAYEPRPGKIRYLG